MIRTLAALFLISPLSHADISPLGKEAGAYLSDLIRINTVNPPGNEQAACDYLAGVLRQGGIPFEIYESTPGRANIVARLKGDGTMDPILLLAHLDTVGVEEESWSFPPFSGIQREGAILGRGSIDDKSMVAAFLTALLELKRTGVRLKRDVIFAATADEESGGQFGVRWLLEKHPEALEAEFAINEGGATQWKDGAVRLIAIQVLEKSYYDIRLTGRGTSGHASVPTPANPIFTLGRALSRIELWERPVVLNDVTRTYLSAIRQFEVPAVREAIEHLLSEEPDRAARAAKEMGPFSYYSSLLRDTVVPTMVHAGIRENVVPSRASLILNVRLLPDTDPEDFLDELREVVDDPAVTIEVIKGPEGPAPGPMPLDDVLYQAISRVAARMAPSAVVIPTMSVGSTDSEFLRRRGVVVYGIEFPLTLEDEMRIHGHDEKMPVRALDFGVRFILEILGEIAL